MAHASLVPLAAALNSDKKMDVTWELPYDGRKKKRNDAVLILNRILSGTHQTPQLRMLPTPRLGDRFAACDHEVELQYTLHQKSDGAWELTVHTHPLPLGHVAVLVGRPSGKSHPRCDMPLLKNVVGMRVNDRTLEVSHFLSGRSVSHKAKMGADAYFAWRDLIRRCMDSSDMSSVPAAVTLEPAQKSIVRGTSWRAAETDGHDEETCRSEWKLLPAPGLPSLLDLACHASKLWHTIPPGGELVYGVADLSGRVVGMPFKIDIDSDELTRLLEEQLFQQFYPCLPRGTVDVTIFKAVQAADECEESDVDVCAASISVSANDASASDNDDDDDDDDDSEDSCGDWDSKPGSRSWKDLLEQRPELEIYTEQAGDVIVAPARYQNKRVALSRYVIRLRNLWTDDAGGACFPSTAGDSTYVALVQQDHACPPRLMSRLEAVLRVGNDETGRYAAFSWLHSPAVSVVLVHSHELDVHVRTEAAAWLQACELAHPIVTVDDEEDMDKKLSDLQGVPTLLVLVPSADMEFKDLARRVVRKWLTTQATAAAFVLLPPGSAWGIDQPTTWLCGVMRKRQCAPVGMASMVFPPFTVRRGRADAADSPVPPPGVRIARTSHHFAHVADTSVAARRWMVRGGVDAADTPRWLAIEQSGVLPLLRVAATELIRRVEGLLSSGSASSLHHLRAVSQHAGSGVSTVLRQVVRAQETRGVCVVLIEDCVASVDDDLLTWWASTLGCSQQLLVVADRVTPSLLQLHLRLIEQAQAPLKRDGKLTRVTILSVTYSIPPGAGVPIDATLCEGEARDLASSLSELFPQSADALRSLLPGIIADGVSVGAGTRQPHLLEFSLAAAGLLPPAPIATDAGLSVVARFVHDVMKGEADPINLTSLAFIQVCLRSTKTSNSEGDRIRRLLGARTRRLMTRDGDWIFNEALAAHTLGYGLSLLGGDTMDEALCQLLDVMVSSTERRDRLRGCEHGSVEILTKDVLGSSRDGPLVSYVMAKDDSKWSCAERRLKKFANCFVGKRSVELLVMLSKVASQSADFVQDATVRKRACHLADEAVTASRGAAGMMMVAIHNHATVLKSVASLDQSAYRLYSDAVDAYNYVNMPCNNSNWSPLAKIPSDQLKHQAPLPTGSPLTLVEVVFNDCYAAIHDKQ